MHHGVLITVNVVWSPRGSSIICRAILWSRAAGHPVPAFHYLSFIALAAWVSQPVASHTDIWMVFCSLWSRTVAGCSHASHSSSHTLLYCLRPANSFLFMSPTICQRWKKESNIKHVACTIALNALFMGHKNVFCSFLRFQNCSELTSQQTFIPPARSYHTIPTGHQQVIDTFNHSTEL